MLLDLSRNYVDKKDEIEEVAKFMEASRRGNLVPLQHTMFTDHLTPVLAYRCLAKEDDREAPSFLFESVEQGSNGTSMGRYSVVGAQPAMEIVAKENSVSIMDHDEGRLTEEPVADKQATAKSKIPIFYPIRPLIPLIPSPNSVEEGRMRMQILSTASHLPSPHLGSSTARTRSTTCRIHFSQLHCLLAIRCWCYTW